MLDVFYVCLVSVDFDLYCPQSSVLIAQQICFNYTVFTYIHVGSVWVEWLVDECERGLCFVLLHSEVYKIRMRFPSSFIVNFPVFSIEQLQAAHWRRCFKIPFNNLILVINSFYIWFVCPTLSQSVWSWPWPTAPVSSMSQWQRSEEALTGRFIRPETQRAGSLWLWRACVSRRTKMASPFPQSERWLCWDGWSSLTTPTWSGKTVIKALCVLSTTHCEHRHLTEVTFYSTWQAYGCMCHPEVRPGDESHSGVWTCGPRPQDVPREGPSCRIISWTH